MSLAEAIIDLTLSDDEQDNRQPSTRLQRRLRRKRGIRKANAQPPDPASVVDLTHDDDNDDKENLKPRAPASHTAKKSPKECKSIAAKANPKPKEDPDKQRAKSILDAVDAMIKPFHAQGIVSIKIEDADAMVSAVKFVECQFKFKRENKPTHASLGYLYTNDTKISINLRFSRELGDGIYSGTNPLAFSKGGSHGVLLAILRGAEQDIRSATPTPRLLPWVDTIITNKTGKSPFDDQIVLRNICQVLPLVRYNRQDLQQGGAAFGNALWSVHQKLQGILDEHLNESVATPLARILAPPPPDKAFGTISYVAPISLTSNEVPFRSVAPPKEEKSCVDHECSICLEDMVLSKNDVVQLNACVHRFHEACLKQFLGSGNEPVCPECRMTVKEPRGRSPSGTMTVSTQPYDCVGFSGCGTIAISYTIPTGIQMPYHPSPRYAFLGMPQHGPIMIPNSDAGRKLLKRMEYAFKRGLCFEVAGHYPLCHVRAFGHATIMTTPVRSTWSDPTMFKRCNDEWTALGVPNAAALEHDSGIQFY